MDGVIHQLRHALVLRGGNRHHRHAQLSLHGVDVDASAVGRDLVHHVQGHHHGHSHLQKLHGQIQVPLDVGGVHDVDDAVGLFVQDEVPGDDLLTAVGRHGVDAGQVRDQGVLISLNGAVLAVHRHTGKIAHVLVGAGEPVEEGGLAAVLVADQGEGQGLPLGHGFFLRAAGPDVVQSSLAQSGMLGFPDTPLLPADGGLFLHRLDLDLRGVLQPEGQLVAVDLQLHGIPHGRELDHGDLRAGNDSHIQKMLAQGSFPANPGYHGGLPDPHVLDCHVFPPKMQPRRETGTAGPPPSDALSRSLRRADCPPRSAPLRQESPRTGLDRLYFSH